MKKIIDDFSKFVKGKVITQIKNYIKKSLRGILHFLKSIYLWIADYRKWKKLLIFTDDFRFLKLFFSTGLLYFIYLLFSPKFTSYCQLKFSIYEIWVMIVIIFSIFYFVFVFVFYCYLSKIKDIYSKDHPKNKEITPERKNNKSDLKNIFRGSVFLLSLLILVITCFVFKKYLDEKLCKDYDVYFKEKKQGTILVTRYKPVETKSIFNKDFTDLDVSSIIYKKFLSLKGKSDTSFKIDYYQSIYPFNNQADYDSLMKLKYDAVLTGEVLKEEYDLKVTNTLFIIDDSISKRLDDFNSSLNDSLKDKNLFNFFSNPLIYYSQIVDRLIENKKLKDYINSQFSFEFDIQTTFPSGFSFTSTIESSPFLVYNYIKILKNWSKIKKDSTSMNSDSLYLEIFKDIDKLIINLNCNKKDTVENYSIVQFLIHLHLLKAYLINKQYHKEGEMVDLFRNRKNIEALFEKAENIMAAANYHFAMLGFEKEESNVFDIMLYFSIYKGILKEIDEKGVVQFNDYIVSRIIPKMLKMKEGIHCDHPMYVADSILIENMKLNTDYENL